MSGEYGVYSDAAGGFIEAPFYTEKHAEAARQELIEQRGEDADDLKVLRICPDHEDQPADTCEECYGEGTNEDEEAGE